MDQSAILTLLSIRRGPGSFPDELYAMLPQVANGSLFSLRFGVATVRGWPPRALGVGADCQRVLMTRCCRMRPSAIG